MKLLLGKTPKVSEKMQSVKRRQVGQLTCNGQKIAQVVAIRYPESLGSILAL